MSGNGPIRVHGLAQCDSCRKARRWFDERGAPYTFVDLREQPPAGTELTRWLSVVGDERLLNRRSRTWRDLPEAERERDPMTLLATHPTLIRRPVVTRGDAVIVGVDIDGWCSLLD